jgi:outer membrane lipoprotein-sorting protein
MKRPSALRSRSASFRLALPLFGAVAGLIAILPFTHAAAQNPTARDVVRQMDAKLRGKTAIVRMTITIRKPRFERTLQLESWDASAEKRSFIRILKPEKDRGITFLKQGTNLWQYIPSIGKEIKIEGSLMQDSWMGSDFTNDDLVRSTSIVDDFDHSFVEGGAADLWRIVLVPKPQAAVVWSKIRLDVRRADNLPARQEFFDHRDRKKKLMEYSDYRAIGGRFLPATVTMISLENDREVSRTVLRYDEASFDVAIPAGIFGKANLRR